MKIIDMNSSGDNKTIKFLQLTKDNIVTETAFIEENDRFIICFASQLECGQMVTTYNKKVKRR